MGALGANEQSAKKLMERSSSLLIVALALSPGTRASDVAPGIGREVAKFSSLDNNLMADLEQILEKNCPKFVTGALPDVDSASASASYEPVRRQVQQFIKQATQHVGLSNIRSFLKLYTAIELEKMAKFNGSKVDEFRSELFAAKHLMSQVENTGGVNPLAGEVKCALDLLFYVNGAMIQVEHADGAGSSNSSGELRHGSFFMQEIVRSEALAARTKRATQDYVNKQKDIIASAAAGGASKYEYDD
jgi:translation initiation factor 3 subunit L